MQIALCAAESGNLPLVGTFSWPQELQRVCSPWWTSELKSWLQSSPIPSWAQWEELHQRWQYKAATAKYTQAHQIFSFLQLFCQNLWEEDERGYFPATANPCSITPVRRFPASRPTEPGPCAAAYMWQRTQRTSLSRRKPLIWCFFLQWLL